MAQQQKDEEVKEQLARLDKWLLSSSERVGVGLLAGFVGSAALRKRWPIVLGLGVALGQSAGDYVAEFCNNKSNGQKDKKKPNGKVDST